MHIRKVLFAAALSSLSLSAVAQNWKLAPVVTDPGFRFQPTVAATVGSIKPTGGNNATAYGLEVNFNCGLLQTPDNRMRTHLSVSRVDENGYDATLVELSPRYTVPLAGGLSVGVGPSLGAVRFSPASSRDESLFAYGLAAGLNYRQGALYAGLDLGVRRTNDKNGIDFDSRSATLKVGFNF